MAEFLSSAPLGRLPSGLLDFFGIKSFGQYPQTLRADIQPQVDLLQWYTATNSQWLFTNTDALAGPQAPAGRSITSTGPLDLTSGGALTIPNNEYWLISEWTTQIGLPNEAAAYGDGQLMYNVPNVGVFHPPSVASGFFTGDAAAGRLGLRTGIGAFLAPPGSILQQLLMGSNSVGFVSLTTRFRLLRLVQ